MNVHNNVSQVIDFQIRKILSFKVSHPPRKLVLHFVNRHIMPRFLNLQKYNFLLFGSFHFLFFGQSDQKRKHQLSCLFVLCIKNPHFAWKWQLFFSLFGDFDQKTENEKWNEPNISRQVWTWIKISRILMIKSRKKRMSHQLISNHQLRSDFSIKLTLVPFIPFLVFWSKWPKNEKISCHFVGLFYKK